MRKRPTDGRPWPPEVEFDYHWNQVVARRDDGSYFTQYVECEGCGWLIGCGDVIESIWHNSCYAAANAARAPMSLDDVVDEIEVLGHPAFPRQPGRWNVVVEDEGVRGCTGSYRWLWRARMQAHSHRRFWPSTTRVITIEWTP